MEKLNKPVRTWTYPYNGDLYRILYDLSGKIFSIRQFPYMQTAHIELDWAQLPHDIQQQFEQYFCNIK